MPRVPWSSLLRPAVPPSMGLFPSLIVYDWGPGFRSTKTRWASLDQIWEGSSSVAQSQWMVNARYSCWIKTWAKLHFRVNSSGLMNHWLLSVAVGNPRWNIADQIFKMVFMKNLQLKRKVFKSGPNSGREFFTCPKPYIPQCTSSFEWCEGDYKGLLPWLVLWVKS